MDPTMELRGRRRRRTQSRINQALRKIRQQWKLLGFFEIDEQHEFYEFTCMLKEGLRASVQNAIDNPVKPENHRASEFTAVLKQSHEGFEMRTYAGPVFARFRRLLGMADREYQTSLSNDKAYLQFISNSRSRADFFLTNDKRFFLKTQSKREIRFLLLNLGKYLEHIERYPHSILVRFLGIHSILVPQEKKKYFIIMQSVFYPHERIIERYDIKGCEVNRWSDPAPEGSEVIVVLKDLNFGEKSICLGHDCGWLVHQVELDTEFLKDLHVLDYSLLVGLQPLHPDERILNQALANIIARATVSLRESSVHNMYSSYWDSDDAACFSSVTQTSSLDHMYKLSLESRSAIKKALSVYLKKRPETEKALEESTKSETFLREVMAPYLMQVTNVDQLAEAASEVSSSASSTEGSSELLGQNRRLLPNTRNPLHTIDGPEYRYFVGIIDLFTVYGFRKKLEYFWKSIRYRGQSFSTVNPVCYARRFCQWVEDHTT